MENAQDDTPIVEDVPLAALSAAGTAVVTTTLSQGPLSSHSRDVTQVTGQCGGES
jgi:hypothetical protein